MERSATFATGDRAMFAERVQSGLYSGFPLTGPITGPLLPGRPHPSGSWLFPTPSPRLPSTGRRWGQPCHRLPQGALLLPSPLAVRSPLLSLSLPGPWAGRLQVEPGPLRPPGHSWNGIRMQANRGTWIRRAASGGVDGSPPGPATDSSETEANGGGSGGAISGPDGGSGGSGSEGGSAGNGDPRAGAGEAASVPTAPAVPAVPASAVPAVPAPGVPAVPAPGVPAVPAPAVPAVPAPAVPAVPAPAGFAGGGGGGGGDGPGSESRTEGDAEGVTEGVADAAPPPAPAAPDQVNIGPTGPYEGPALPGAGVGPRAGVGISAGPPMAVQTSSRASDTNLGASGLTSASTNGSGEIGVGNGGGADGVDGSGGGGGAGGGSRAAGGAVGAEGDAMGGFRERLRDLRELMGGAVEGLWRSLDTWYTRLAFVVGLMCVIVTAVVNAVLVPVVNVHVLPTWEQRAAAVLQRDVSLGRIRWVGLGGVTGVVPLVRLGAVRVGPRWSGAERSYASAPHLALYLEPLTSLVYRQAVLRLHAEAPQVTIVQGPNFSWFGYPEDTTDNARNFVPGLGTGTGTAATAAAPPHDRNHHNHHEGPHRHHSHATTSDGGGGGSNGSSSQPSGGHCSEHDPSHGQHGGASPADATRVAATLSSDSGKGRSGSGNGSRSAAGDAAAEAGSSDKRVDRASQQLGGDPGSAAPQGKAASQGGRKPPPPPHPPLAALMHCPPLLLPGLESSATSCSRGAAVVPPSPSAGAAATFTGLPAFLGPGAGSGVHWEALHLTLQRSQKALQEAVCEQLLQLPVVDWVLQPLLLQQQQQQQRGQQAAKQVSGVSGPAAVGATASPVTPGAAGARGAYVEEARPGRGWAGRLAGNSTTAFAAAAATDVPRHMTHALASTSGAVPESAEAVYGTGGADGAGLQRRQRLWADRRRNQSLDGRREGRMEDERSPRLPQQQQQLAQQQDELKQMRAGRDGSQALQDLGGRGQEQQSPFQQPGSGRAVHGQALGEPIVSLAGTILGDLASAEAAGDPRPQAASSSPATPLACVSSSADIARTFLHVSSGGGGSGGGGGVGPRGVSPAAAAALVAEIEDSLPPVALGSVTMRNGSLRVFIVGEMLPRRLEYVSGSMSLGRNYRSLEVAVEGDAFERPAASAKCTMVNPSSKRHLRHVTPGAAAGSQPPRRFGCDNLQRGTALVLQHASAISELAAPAPPPPPPPAAANRAYGGATAEFESQGHRHNLHDHHHHHHRSGHSHNRHSRHSPSTSGSSTVEDGDTGGGPKGTSGSSSLGGGPAAATAVEDRVWVSRYCETVRPQRGKFSSRDAPQNYTLRTYGLLLRQEEIDQLTAAVVSEGTHGSGSSPASQVISDPFLAMAEEAAAASSGGGITGGGGAVGDAGGRAGAAGTMAVAGGGGGSGGSGGGGGSRNAAGRRRRRHKGPEQPTGGRVSVSLTSRGMALPGVWPDLTVTVRGERLHGPLIERLLELPMDIHDGRVDGELKLRSYDTASWQFPELYGRIKCRGASLHFWDSPDDISSADMDLVLERGRMYLLGAVGRFGAVPITITGDMDLNPETGTYRLQSNVPGTGVELNALRASLGVRPIPISAAGAVRGVLHCTGPLERPSFSGTAVAVRPSPEQLAAGLEATPALEALLGHSTAVGAYDKVPLLGAQGVFTLDMATQMLNLHSIQVQPDGGGSLLASGRMWLAPAAEADPQAISVSGEASGVDADRLARYYLPPDVELPDGVRIGSVMVRGVMAGSHLAPAVEVSAEAPAARVVGSASFSQTAISLSARSPAFSVDGTVHTSLPYLAQLRASDTQAEATYFARPRFMGADLELHCAAPGADLLPLATGPATPPPFDPLAANQPLHLRVAGHTRLALRPTPPATQSPQGALAAAAAAAASSKQPPQAPALKRASGGGGGGAGKAARRRQGGDVAAVGADGGTLARVEELEAEPLALPRHFEGAISLSGVRINSLELVRGLAGTASIDGAAGTVAIRARGGPAGSAAAAAVQPLGGGGGGGGGTAATAGGGGGAAVAALAVGGGGGGGGGAPDVLDLELAVPDLMAALNLEASEQPPPVVIYRPAPQHAAASAASDNMASGGTTQRTSSSAGLGSGGEFASRPYASTPYAAASPRGTAPALPSAWASVPAAEAASASPQLGRAECADSHFRLTRGSLLLEAEVVNGGAEVSVQVANLQLDDLEAGSLRGVLRSASLAADVAGRRGRGSCSAEGLRLSSLAVGSFGGAVRWEGDIVKLEETVLEQRGSRYEVSGEVFLPGFGATTTATAGATPQPSPSPQPTLASDAGWALPPPNGPASPAQSGVSSTASGTTASAAAKAGASGRPRRKPAVNAAAAAVTAPVVPSAATAAGDVRSASPSPDPWYGITGASARAPTEAPAAKAGALRATTVRAVVTGGGGGGGGAGVEYGTSGELSEGEVVAAGGGGGGRKGRTVSDGDEGDGETSSSDCRWRLQINVPSAQISDLLPAVQLATSASRPGTDYGAAKARFLEAIQSGAASAISPPDVRLQVDLFSSLPLVDAASAASGATALAGSTPGVPPAAAATAGVGGTAAVPALSELSGRWSGSIKLYGGLAGPSTIDFSLAGREWRWGPTYRLDRLVAMGSVDSGEGVALEELAVDAGPARLRASGSLLCPRQDAWLALYDFPLGALAPLTSTAMPALERAAATAKARGAAQASPLAALGKRLDATLQNLGLKPPVTEGGDGGSGAAAGGLLGPHPGAGGGGGALSGRLFVDGRLAGSVSRPQASVRMRVEDGAIGGALLGRAQASLEVDPQQRLHVDVDLAPRAPTRGSHTASASAAPTGAVVAAGASTAVTGPAGLSSGSATPAPGANPLVPSPSAPTGSASGGGYVRLVGTARLPAASTRAAAAGADGDAVGRQPDGADEVSMTRKALAPVGGGGGGGGGGVSWPSPPDVDAAGAWGAAVATAAKREAGTARGGQQRGREAVEGIGAVGLEEDEYGSASAAGRGASTGGGEEATTVSGTTSEDGEDVVTPTTAAADSSSASDPSTNGSTSRRESGDRPYNRTAAEPGPAVQLIRPAAAAVVVAAPPAGRLSEASEVSEEGEDVRDATSDSASRASEAMLAGVAEWQMEAQGQNGVKEERKPRQEREDDDAEEEKEEEELFAELHVRDGGMGLLVAMVPECEWQGGSAAVDLRVHGRLAAPQVEGRARLTRGTILSPLLRYPITNLNADIQFDGSTLHARSVDASLGKTGTFRVRGALPVQPIQSAQQPTAPSSSSAFGGKSASAEATVAAAGSGGADAGGVIVEVEGAEVRARGVYGGLVDGRLVVRRSLTQPLLGGRLRFSRGVAYLLPQQGATATASPPATSASSSSSSSPSPSPSDRLDGLAPVGDSREGPEVVRTSFSLLKAGRKRAMLGAGAAGRHGGPMGGGALAMEPDLSSGSGASGGAAPPGPSLVLSGLEVVLGPDLRAIFPVVLNLGIGGSVTLNGAADPERLQLAGVINLESGTLNLVATQFVLDREHDNRIIFAQPETAAVQQQQQALGGGAASTPGAPGAAAPSSVTAATAGAATAVTGAAQSPGTGAATGQPGAAAAAAGGGTSAGGASSLPPPSGPIDPIIDIVLVSGDLRATIQGRSSSWQEGLSLTASGTPLLGGPGGAGGGGGVGSISSDSLAASLMGGSGPGGGAAGVGVGSGPSGPGGATAGGAAFGGQSIGEAARVLEERLADALLGEKGQLALRSLARSTVSSLLPRIETRGQVGHARWRLVGAPSLPSLLSLPDPVAEPSRFLSTLALGTEVELAFGRRLQASLSHKLQEIGRSGTELPGGGGGTEARLSLQLSSRLRLQAHLARGALLPSVTLQYSSEGTGGGAAVAMAAGPGGGNGGSDGAGGAPDGVVVGGDGGDWFVPATKIDMPATAAVSTETAPVSPSSAVEEVVAQK